MKLNRFLVFSGYLMAAYLMLAPSAETLAALRPFRFADAGWRYGATGLVSQSLMTPLLGLVLAVGVAVYCGHRVRARFLAVASALGGFVTLMAIPLFTLDALEMRTLVPADQGAPTGAFDVATVSALVMMTAAVALAFALALGAWAGTRQTTSDVRQRHAPAAPSAGIVSAAPRSGAKAAASWPAGEKKRMARREIQRWESEGGFTGP